jgi:dTDP-4-dehydrorhamnose 3,5-epimerase
MLNDIKVINVDKFSDHRGYLWTVWKSKKIKNLKFNHDKVSISKKNTLRGLHCDFKSWKLITCLYGKIFFSVVNFKKNSKNYLKSKSWILDYKKPKLIIVPPYYANGHLCLSNQCVFFYKWSYKGKYINANQQKSYKWNDPKFKIKWPIKKPILSLRDKKSKFL